MPTLELVRTFKKLQNAAPTANAARMRLRATALRRIEAELQQRAQRALEHVEAHAKGERSAYVADM